MYRIRSSMGTEHQIAKPGVERARLVGAGNLGGRLKSISDAVAQSVNADLVQIWMIRRGDLCEKGCIYGTARVGLEACLDRTLCLHLMARSGQYAHIDGGHHREPLGCHAIGGFAAGPDSRLVIGDMAGDERLQGWEWASRLGLTFFTSCQLRSEDGRPIGVLALFCKDSVRPEENRTLEVFAGFASEAVLSEIIQESLQESEAKHKALVESCSDAIVMLDEDGKVLSCNPAFLCLFGYEREEIEAKSIRLVHVSDEHFHRYGVLSNSQISLEGTFRCEWDYRKKDGAIVQAETVTSAIRDEGGSIVGYAAIIRDISDRKRAEKELHEERHKLSVLSEKAPYGLLTVDENGNLTYVNPKFTETMGYTIDDIPDGRTWFRKAYPDPAYRHEVIAAWIHDAEKARPGEKRPRVFTATCKNGTTKIIHFIPVALESGKHIVTIDDITERTRAVESLGESEKRLADIFDYLPDPTFVIDNDHVVIAWNKAMEAMTGVRANDMVGKDDYAYGVPFYGARRPILIDLALSPDDGSIEEKYPFIKKERDTFYTEIFIPAFGHTGAYLWAKAKPLHDSSGNVIGAIETIRDVTERRGMTEALQTERERFKILSESVPFGLVLFDKNGNFKYLNPKFAELFGYDLDDIPDGATWFKKAYPDHLYRKTVALEWTRFVNAGEPGEQRSRVFQTLCKDGSEKTVSFTSVRLSTGEFLMTCEDITERTRMETNLRKAYQATRDITDNAPFGIYLLDDRGAVEYINNAMLEISGDTPEQILGANLLQLPTYLETGLSEKMLSGLTGQPFRVDAVRYRSYFGKKETIRNFIGIPLEQAGSRKLLMIVEDVTKQKRLEEELKALSLKDELTGLYNRRGFFALAEQQLKVADRTKTEAMLIYADLDRMKWINDTLGHEEGDRALIAASKILVETFRESDIIARIGGDEFVVLATEISSSLPRAIELRLQDTMDHYNAGVKPESALSMSIGTARYYPENPASLDMLIALADRLMYEEKRKKIR